MAISIEPSVSPSSTRKTAGAAAEKAPVQVAKAPPRGDSFGAAARDYSALGGGGEPTRGAGEGVQLAFYAPPRPEVPDDQLVKVYTNQGYWIGATNTSAIHENLSLRTLGESLNGYTPARGGLLASLDKGQLPTDATDTDVDIRGLPMDLQQWARGSRWPDDPESRLFHDPVGTTRQTMGAEWHSETTTAPSGDGTDLTRRSFSGDLLYLHAMATTAGERPEATQARIVNWTSFLGEVATGRIPPTPGCATMPTFAPSSPIANSSI